MQIIKYLMFYISVLSPDSKSYYHPFQPNTDLSAEVWTIWAKIKSESLELGKGFDATSVNIYY